jgi:quercetin dioxygenase-like cupin family protein
MKISFVATTLVAAMAFPLIVDAAPTLTILSVDAQAVRKGPPANFTGAVQVKELFPAKSPSNTSGGLVTFAPGARSGWHTHPLGQTLIVTAGKGWIQQQNRAKQEMKAGDVVTIPPGVEHWHGATQTTGVSHIAIQEAQNGKNVEWLRPVSDPEYGNAAM